MAGRNKQPVALLETKGKAHLTKEQKEKRREEEVKVPQTEIVAPPYLKGAQRKKFNEYAGLLKRINDENHGEYFTQLDVECLARYILSQDLYLTYTNRLIQAAEEDIDDIKAIQLVQNRAFNQAHQSAASLGLSITSRCKIVIPQKHGDGDDDKDIL